MTDPDLFFGSALALRQPARGAGYRVNIDAFLLARRAIEEGSSGKYVIDLGAGVGAVGLAIAALGSPERVLLVEQDEEAAALLTENARPFACADVLTSDVRDARVDRAEVIVANPPYTPETEGPAAPERRRAAARSGDLEPFLEATERLMSPPGCAVFILPAAALSRLLGEIRQTTLHVASLRFVHACADRPARAVLATLRATRQNLAIESPWFEWQGRGVPDAELSAFLRGPSGLRR